MFNYLSLEKEKTLLITPSSLKNKIREEIMSYNKLMDIKIISIDELKNRLFFEPLDKTFTTLYYKFNKPLSIINTLIDYLYYVDINIEYKNQKINELKEIKKYLFKNNLVKFDNRFKINLKQYKIKFIGFTIIDKETNFIINELKKINDIEIIDYYDNKFTPSLVHTTTIEEEITYVCYSIAKLLEQGENINNIKLCNVNEEYYFYLKRIFKNYNIPLNIKSNVSLLDLPLTSIFLNLLKENSKEETISILKEQYPLYRDYINMYISILNKYAYLNNVDLTLIIYELKNTKLKNKTFSNSIDIIDLNEIGNSNFHIFVMSCNYNYFPSIKKDEDYLIDQEKLLLGISTSKEMNKNNIETIKKIIHSSPFIYLSYKEISYFNDYHKVDFLNDIKEINFNKNILDSFSINEDKIQLIKNLDNNLYNSDTLILNYNYKTNYQEYDASFKGIDEEVFKKFFKDKNLTISYSNLNTYYECPFKFYIDNVLKLNEYKDTVYTIIGNIMHKVIENCFKPDFNFENSFNYFKDFYINKTPLKASELFFIENIKSRALEVVNYLKSHEEFTLLNKHWHEKNIKFDIEINNYIVTIKGYIDKLIYTEINNVIYTAIIDLKTGKQTIEPNKFEFGLSLQLPFYVYLLKHDSKFKNSKILGLYIHNILNDVNDEINLKYNGLTLNNLNTLAILDKNYQNSSIIKNLKINSDGSFSKHAKLISEKELDELYNLVEAKLNEMIENVLARNFIINPKRLDDKTDLSCEYCNYSSICYKTLKDYTYLKTKKGEKNNA